jgi:hypothetical protein
MRDIISRRILTEPVNKAMALKWVGIVLSGLLGATRWYMVVELWLEMCFCSHGGEIRQIFELGLTYRKMCDLVCWAGPDICTN